MCKGTIFFRYKNIRIYFFLFSYALLSKISYLCNHLFDNICEKMQIFRMADVTTISVVASIVSNSRHLHSDRSTLSSMSNRRLGLTRMDHR